MNINDMKAVVVAGQIATLRGQIEAWNIYAKRTGESVTTIVAAINAQITALQAL